MVDGDGYAFQAQSCYGQDSSYCGERIEGVVVVRGFVGKTGSRYAPVTADVECPASGSCGIVFEGWDVEAGRGAGWWSVLMRGAWRGLVVWLGRAGEFVWGGRFTRRR